MRTHSQCPRVVNLILHLNDFWEKRGCEFWADTIEMLHIILSPRSQANQLNCYHCRGTNGSPNADIKRCEKWVSLPLWAFRSVNHSHRGPTSRCTYSISFCTTGREETWGWRTTPTWRLGRRPSHPGLLSCLQDSRRWWWVFRAVPQRSVCWSSTSAARLAEASTGSGLRKRNRNAASAVTFQTAPHLHLWWLHAAPEVAERQEPSRRSDVWPYRPTPLLFHRHRSHIRYRESRRGRDESVWKASPKAQIDR